MMKSLRDKLGKYILDTISFRNTVSKNARLQMATGAVLEGSFVKGAVTLDEYATVRRAHLDGQIHVGRYSQINGPGVYIMGAVHGVAIGSFCSIARNVNIQEHNHNHTRLSTFFFHKHFFSGQEREDIISAGPITIGNDVWIGANATILSNVTIGHGAVIAANALVTKDVEPYSIVGGTPATVLKKRFHDDVIEKLLALRWWDWTADKIKRNEPLFTAPMLTIEMLNQIRE